LATERFKIVDLDLRPTAEDFGFYTQRYPSLFYRLGVGGTGTTHTSDFCPDERAITAGIEFMHLLTLKLTNKDGKEEK
jgi:metal-dependent amidase/aminoacylase/carboxypeptidase family protein